MAITATVNFNYRPNPTVAGAQSNQTGTSTLTQYNLNPIPQGAYEVGGYIDVTAFTLGILNFQVVYNDNTGSSNTLLVPLTSLAGAVSPAAGALGDFSTLVTSIQTDGSADIVVSVVATGFTGQYTAYGYIKFIATPVGQTS